MKKLVREMLVIAMLAVASVGAFAQKDGKGRGQDKRPVKEKEVVVDRKNNRPPPPQNTNQPKGDKKGRP